MKNLLIYRTTPLQIDKSPAELLMNRKLRSNLPINGDLLTPYTAKEVVTDCGPRMGLLYKKLHHVLTRWRRIQMSSSEEIDGAYASLQRSSSN